MAGRTKSAAEFTRPVSIPEQPVRSTSESGRIGWPPEFMEEM
jgi:hypothetical protein